MSKSTRGYAVACLFAGLLAVPGPASQAAERLAAPVEQPISSPVLWGLLRAGRYGVGFRRHFVRDPSRTWEVSASAERAAQADLDGRPIQFNTWYPAAVTGSARPMRLADYPAQSVSNGYALLNRVMDARTNWGPAPHADDLTRLAAVLGARPATGHFPVVLMFCAHGDDLNANVVMAEYLASHGMVVVSVSLLGPSDEDTYPSGGSDGVEMTVRDMEYVMALVRRYSYVDPARIAAAGHSLGAVEALVLAMRNGWVSAVVGLDGTYGFKDLAYTVTGAVGYSPDRFTGSLLDARRAEGEGGAELDNTVLESLRLAERWQVTMPSMQHNDFTSRAETGALAFHGEDLPAVVQSGMAGYEFVCALVKDFLAMHFQKSGKAEFDRAAAARSVGAGYIHWAAEAPTITAWQQWAATIPKGQEAIESKLRERCGSEPLETCAAVEALGKVGGEMSARGQPREALIVNQVLARAKPKSVFAQDFLADAYGAVGDWAGYRRAVERAIELMPTDPGLRPDVAPSFEQMERDKLARLPK